MVPAMTTTPPSTPRRAIAAAAVAAAFLGAAAATAQADSIAYVKAHNVWIAEPDGSAQHQVTRDGTADWPYRSPSQADDGTIAAAHGTDLVRLAQNGTVLSRFDPPDSTDSAGQLIGGHPSHVALSPDGHRIAYTYVHANCPPGVSCGTRAVTLVSHSDRPTPPETFGRVHLSNPSWAGNDRLLVFGGFLRQVNHWTPGQPAETHWFDDKDLFGIENSTDLGDGELGADRFAAVRGYGDSTHLMFYKATGFGGAPAYACNTGNESTLDSPTWSPDGTRIAFAHKDGVEVLPLPSVEPDCPGASSGTVVLPGASEPDWGPAAVAPAALPTPVTPGQPGKPAQPAQPARPGAKRACAAKPAGKARRRCRALRKCKAKPTKRARARCVRKVKRRFK
jgi:Tol biopolymer transport system component